MPLCGFNQEMLEGLRMFHQGLVSHGLIERSKVKNQEPSKTLEQELKDMNEFLSETHNIENPTKRELIESLTRYVKVFYKLIQERGIENSEDVIESLTRTYESMDRKFYSELEDQPNRMKQLANYINSTSKTS